MNEFLKQFTAQLASELKAKFSSPEIADFISKAKASGDDRSFEVVMSTSDEDRQGDALDQSKWDLKYFNMNPVVLWAHSYSGFPIGVVDDITIQGSEAIAKGHFAPQGVNAEADMACALYQEKILRAVSPGYIQNDDGTRELLELSFCPVPAGRHALSLRQVGRLGVSTRELVTKGFFYAMKGAVPYTDHGIEAEDAKWDGPAQVKACGDDLKKLKAICTWFDPENDEKKSGYKLPHHNAESMKANWNGVKAAMGAIMGARGGAKIDDKEAVYNHLKKHYAQFDKDAPEFSKAMAIAATLHDVTGPLTVVYGGPGENKRFEFLIAKTPQIGDHCQLNDGTPGVLAQDDKDPGELICIPERDKSTSESMKAELEKNFKAEHDRHGQSVGKAIDEFSKKALPDEKKENRDDGSDNSETDKAIEEFKDALDAEHGAHLEKCMKAIDNYYETMGREANKSADHAQIFDLIAKSIEEFKSAINGEHLTHVKAFHKAIDEFTKDFHDSDTEAGKKAIDQFEKKAGDELDRHEKACTKVLKEHMGEGEDDGKDEKAIKAGRAISAKNKDKLKAILEKMDSHHGEVTAALRELIGSPDGDGGEEPKPDEKSGTAPNSRSSTSGATVNGMSDLEAYLFTQRLVRQVKTASEGALRQLNEKIRDIRSARS